MYILEHFDEYLDGKLLNKLGAIQKQKEKHVLLKFPLFSRSDDKNSNVCMQEKFAQILHRCGVEKISLIEIHSRAALKIYEDIFGKENVVNYSAAHIFAEYIIQELAADVSEIAIGAPDGGDKLEEMAIARVDQLQNPLKEEFLKIGRFYITKKREDKIVEISNIQGDVEGKICVLFDDLIDTGASIIAAAEKLKEQGASNVICMATHACFNKAAFDQLLKCKSIGKILVTDSIQKNYKIQPYFKDKFGVLPLDLEAMNISF